MARIAFVTDRLRPEGTEDDRRLAPLLPGLRFVAWEDGPPDADVVVVRSPWNYCEHAADFAAWIDAVRAPLWNPAALLRWNLDKRYLDALPDAVAIPTRWITRDDALGDIPRPFVVKPAISAGGRDTWCVTDALLPGLSARLPPGPLLAQPMLPEVRTRGERSLVYFGGAYSHAVCKLPAEGHFLVHEEHGGRVVAHEASPAERRAAEQALSIVPGAWLYARVDLIPDGAAWRCVEIECVEPELFFRFDPASGPRFVGALRQLVG